MKPKMFVAISRMTSFPRHFAGAVSVCQTGAVDVLIPLPTLIFPSACPLRRIRGDVDLPQNDPSDKHLCQAERGRLQDHSDGHDRRAQEQRLLPTQPLTESEGGNGTQETTDIVDRRHGGENLCSLGANQIMEFQEILRDHHTTCVPSVSKSFSEDGQAGAFSTESTY